MDDREHLELSYATELFWLLGPQEREVLYCVVCRDDSPFDSDFVDAFMNHVGPEGLPINLAYCRQLDQDLGHNPWTDRERAALEAWIAWHRRQRDNGLWVFMGLSNRYRDVHRVYQAGQAGHAGHDEKEET